MELGGFSVDVLLILFLVSIVAGFIDTLAGGGGLITMPALLISGIPPLAALGTNKLQGSVGTATATYMMFKHKKISWQNVRYMMLLAFVGSVLGSVAVQFINTELLSFVVPIALLFVAVYFVIAPMPGEGSSKPRLSLRLYQYTVVPLIGWYDGMFGPGTGSFFSLAGVTLRGHNLRDSTAVAKAFNFSTNIASLIVFMSVGQLVIVAGLSMMIGQIIGAWFGSHMLFKISPVYLRVLVVLMCLGMLIKYSGSMEWV